MSSKIANETEYKAAIDLALLALRSAILINGGAAIAILAFWSYTNGVSSTSINSANIVTALGNFAQGVLGGGFATLTGYLSQRLFAFHSGSSKVAIIFNCLSIILIAWAYWSFYSGIIECQRALVK